MNTSTLDMRARISQAFKLGSVNSSCDNQLLIGLCSEIDGFLFFVSWKKTIVHNEATSSFFGLEGRQSKCFAFAPII